MKQFEKVRDQILQYITANSGGLWYTVGYRGQSNNADDQRGSAMVKAVIVGLSPDRITSSMNGEKRCRLTIDLEITVSSKSSLDITGLDDDTKTDLERKAILADIVDAEDNANRTMDSIFGRLFDLFMGGDGEWFGLSENTIGIADRWGDDFRKEKVERFGSTVVLSGFVSLSCAVVEIPNGSVTVDGTIVNGLIDIQQGSGLPLAVQSGV